jgi:hypothetical protein
MKDTMTCHTPVEVYKSITRAAIAMQNMEEGAAATF